MTKETKNKIIAIAVVSVISIVIITTAIITKMDLAIILATTILSEIAMLIVLSTLFDKKQIKEIDKKKETEPKVQQEETTNVTTTIEIGKEPERQEPKKEQISNEKEQKIKNKKQNKKRSNKVIVLNIIKYILFGLFAINLVLTIAFYLTVILMYLSTLTLLIAIIELIFAIYIERKVQSIKQNILLNEILENIKKKEN